jgi:hypothetical protein
MKKRDLIIVIVVLAFGMIYNFVESGEIVFSEGCSFSNRALRDRQHPNPFPREEMTFDAADVKKIEIDNRAGGIEIVKAEDDTISISPEVRVYHRKKDRAQKIEKDIEITSSIDGGDTLKIAIKPDERFPYTRVRVYFKVTVPENTELDMWNRFGDIDITGVGKKIKADGKHGDVKIRNVDSDLKVRHRHGKVILRNIKGAVDLSSRHSRISIENIVELKLNTAHAIVAIEKVEKMSEIDISHSRFAFQHGNGLKLAGRHNRLKLQNITNGVKVTDSHSSISLKDAGGDINIKGRHSGIRLERVAAGEVVIRDSYDYVTIEDISAKSLDVLMSHGRLTLDLRAIEERINIKAKHTTLRLSYPQSIQPLFNIELVYGNLKNRTDTEFTVLKERHRLRLNSIEGSPGIIINNKYGDLYLNHNSLKPITPAKPETETFTEPTPEKTEPEKQLP